ncbi:MAG: transglycosylase SLT domain-containing protein [Elusimicrobia bacterium]|nr:transglycosylase SLT domain-containing protein [Elusimicrobiota bacterium]
MRGLERVAAFAGLWAALAATAQAAPDIPADQAELIVEAAAEAGIDPALLAATASRESTFAPRAYRAEPSLRAVLWRDYPGGPERWVTDGSVGPTQVLRSTMKGWGVDNEAEAFDLRTNYRVSARILRANLDNCGSAYAAALAYNTGSCRGYAPYYASGVVADMQAYAGVFSGSSPSATASCVATEEHVRRWYRQFLGREADEGAMWGRVGNDCGTVQAVIQWSEEAMRRRDPSHCSTTEADIRRWYAEYLGREAEEGAMWGRVGNTCAVVEGVIRDSEEARIRRGEI